MFFRRFPPSVGDRASHWPAKLSSCRQRASRDQPVSVRFLMSSTADLKVISPAKGFCPSQQDVGSLLSDCTLSSADSLPEPRRGLAALYLSPGTGWQMHLHSCDPCTEHLCPRWAEQRASAAHGEGRGPAGTGGRPRCPLGSHYMSPRRLELRRSSQVDCSKVASD